ncbi:MAG TPA: replication initiator [Acidimicrobiales bacterium]|nr:replication initiator [Acidimicrobiales bacterium]
MAERVERVGGCRHPIRLRGTSKDGGYTTSDEPDGVLLVACGTRRASRCPSCSATYKGDARQLVLAGLEGGKGVPETVSSHSAVFATLTAPSFGAVHSAGKGRCHLGPPGVCPHGRSRHCLEAHDPGDDVVGSPLCRDCYDYVGAVMFNATAGELWRRVTIYAFRHLAYALGTTPERLREEVRLSYTKVVEFQRRGVVHIHAVVRADAADDDLAEPPIAITANLLVEALHRAVGAVRVARSIGDRRLVLSFGTQLRVDPIERPSRAAVASYVAKYTVKSADRAEVLDHRLRDGEIDLLELPHHVEALVRTALEVGQREGLGRLQRWAHAFAFSGHVLTKSRRYSTTFGELRLARRIWRVEGGDEVESIGFTRWSFKGTGYRCEIDHVLAISFAERRRQGRLAAYEKRRSMDRLAEAS